MKACYLLPLTALTLPAVFAVSSSSHAKAVANDLSQTIALREDVRNVVVIYAENRSFDNLYGNFPDADGLSTVMNPDGTPTSQYSAQVDRDGRTPLKELPRTWGGVTARDEYPVVSEWRSARLPNVPFSSESAFGDSLTSKIVTRDLVHRFFQHQMQIHGGKNDMFAAWSDAGGLTMGYFGDTTSKVRNLAREYVLADHFFQGAFGGSFLNHQYLICACAPEYRNADTSVAKFDVAELDKDVHKQFLPSLKKAAGTSISALDGPPVFVNDGDIAPRSYFGDGTFRAVNTMQPPFQPSGNPPATTAAHDPYYADPNNATTLPAQTALTIADLLDRAKKSWRWYAGAWNSASTDGMQRPSTPRTVIYKGNPSGHADVTNSDFQPHHQPFNYYAAFDPVRRAGYRKAHLQDYQDLRHAIEVDSLPDVAFYKPEGLYNQHEGTTNLFLGDSMIADLVMRLKKGKQWEHMVIIITYDEFGGTWDHVAPPRGDLLGPGSRIPAIIISPFAKSHTVDHTSYDTGSIVRFIRRVFALDELPALAARDFAIQRAGGTKLGDLTNALMLR